MTTISARIGLALALIVGWSLPSTAQPGGRPPWPSAPWERGLVAEGLPVSPFFEGWYENPDGTYTISFGYFNRNREETVMLPVGPDNFLSPASYDGGQPTVFTPGRSTGVFTVTVPAELGRNDGRVVWTLRTGNGPPHSVPGKVGVEAYRLHHAPMAMGSLPPRLRLQDDGPVLWGAMTLAGDAREASSWSGDPPPGSLADPVPLTTTVGTPLRLSVYVEDRYAPDAEREPVRPGVTWATHRGPARATLADGRLQPEDGETQVTTTATFPEPGVYLLRVRADNFNPVDSTPQDQCCWTNGYVEVMVEPGE